MKRARQCGRSRSYDAPRSAILGGSVLGEFALASAYLGVGDIAHARAALLQTRRLLMPLAGDTFVTGTDSLAVETLRQTIETRLVAIAGRQEI